MISVPMNTEEVRTLLESRGLTDALNNLPEKNCGMIAKTERERIYLLKYAIPGKEELVCMRIYDFTDDDVKRAENWFYARIDRTSLMMRGANEHLPV